MPTNEEERFKKLVESVVDGEAVDWNDVTFQDPSIRDRLRQLRALESLTRPDRSKETSSSANPPETWGPLRILEKLSDGGSAEVYRALDPALDREVALKLQRPAPAPDAAMEARFLDEARRLAKIRHPNVLFVHGVGKHDGRAGLWTDLLRGSTLEQRLAGEGPLDATEAARIGISLCRALGAVHAAGLLHGDVKTANVMQEDGGRIVLMDFNAGTDRAGLSVRGSPLYLAPEIFRAEPPSAASDLYALGVVLFRLVTGRHPVEADTLEDLTAKHANGDRRNLKALRPNLPGRFVQTVERALSPDPSRRFATAEEMESALSRCLQGKMAKPWMAIASVMILTAAVLLARPLIEQKAFTVEASLYRQTPGGTAPLASGDQVQPGDQLFVEIEGSHALHVYVLDEDEAGRTYVLFPIAGMKPENPLPRGKHRLPGTTAGVPRTWEVDTAGGKETVLLVASRKPLEDLDEALTSLDRPVDPMGLVEATPVMRQLRGIGRLGASQASKAPENEGVSALLERLGLGPDRAPEVWVREIQLRNPGA